MNKKELLQLPVYAPDWLFDKAEEKDWHLVREQFGDIRVYAWYEKGSLLEGDDEPCFIIFRDKHTWLNYEPQDKKWTKGSIDRSGRWMLYKYRKVLQNLRRWQNRIVAERGENRKAAENEKTKAVMADVPELPEDFEEFCIEEAMKEANYIFYSTKKREVFCSHCKQTCSLERLKRRNEPRKLKHGAFMMCDHCKEEYEALSEGISRGKRCFGYSTQIIQKFRDGVIIRDFNMFRDFSKSMNPKTEIYEQRRYVCERGKYREYEKTIIPNRPWRLLKPGQNFSNIAYRIQTMYTKNLSTVLRNTVFAGYGVESLLKKNGNHIYRGYNHVMRRICERPYLEQLYKAGGLKDLYFEMYNSYGDSKKIDAKQSELTKMLKINKQQLEWIRKIKKEQYEALHILQIANENRKSINEAELLRILHSKDRWNEERLLKYPEVKNEKAIEYCEKNNIKVNDFVDHLDMMRRLNIRMNKRSIYPSDFDKAHGDEIEQDVLENSEVGAETQKMFKRTYAIWKEVLKDVQMQQGEYIIVFPKDCVDIKKEGRILHHCVGGYTDRATSGGTVILFMRKREEQERRLYTMEYRDGKLIQIRGTCNQAPEEEARKFAVQFAEQFREAEEKYKEKKAV